MIKILLANLEQGAEITSGYLQYPLLFWRHFVPHSYSKIKQSADQFDQLDYGLFTEDLIPSNRTRFQSLSQLATKHKNRFSSVTKYGECLSITSNQILSTDEFLLSFGRKLIISDINHNDINITIAHTHLSLRSQRRRVQVQEITNHLESIKGPLILTGDFNDESIEFNQLQNIKTPFTYPSWSPKKSLLRIYGRDLDNVSINVKCSDYLFSDHRGLIISLADSS